MTPEEKAVLDACNERLELFMQERHLKTIEAVINEVSYSKTPASNLIRAVAMWRLSNTSDSQPTGETK